MSDKCAKFELDLIKAVRTAATQTLVVLVGTQFALMCIVSNSNYALTKHFGTSNSSSVVNINFAIEFSQVVLHYSDGRTKFEFSSKKHKKWHF